MLAGVPDEHRVGFLVAMVASVAVQQTDRGDDMFTVMANRHAHHIADHDSVELIEAR